ncbi:unnamed protein product [Cuscuta epithymum]|uniref:FAF domain-containing protein n=1 Tax=Cuscuta epithymum TaxID=186058 RepID=A0AAV0DM53_9ASTE|nr:unnamed protein product [Cuscuta epithymum]
MYRIELPEFLGTESHVEFVTDLEGTWAERTPINIVVPSKKKQQQKSHMKKEYPPTLTWLARTDGQPTSRVKWVMKRNYTHDERLIITKEKSKRYEYFQVDRSDGKLRADLIQLHEHMVEGRISERSSVMESSFGTEVTLVEGASKLSINDENGNGGGNKCSTLIGFGVAMSTINPIQT